MPDDSIIETQTPTEEQKGEGEVETPKETQGGPSDEFKMKRLEQKNLELAEKIRRNEEKEKAREEESLTPEEKFTTEQEGFYREKTGGEITLELSKDIEKLPKALQERIKADPFNPAWLDAKTLEFELYGVDADDAKAKYAAVKKAALKSIPEFVAGFGTEEKLDNKEDSFGTNPPLAEKNSMTGGKDLWQMTDEELIALKKAEESSVL
jgi:hypothetical protein